MSEQIDWGKAPEGATHWEPSSGGVTAGWMKLENNIWYFWPTGRWDSYEWNRASAKTNSRSGKMIPRPATPSWSGEGLPPVGTVLEAIDKEINGGTWSKMVVLAVGKHGQDDCLMVAEVIEGQSRPGAMVASLYTGWERSFRPIRTPEQVAEDERQAAVDQMVNDATNPMDERMLFEKYPGDTFVRELVGCLYNAGYRKP